MGPPGQKCLSGVQTNGSKWHVRVDQMSRQSAKGWGGAVWPGEVQVHTPIGVAGTSRSYLIIMYAHGSSRMHLYLFILYFGAMHNYCCCLIFITISGEDFNLTAKELSEFSTGNFFLGGEGGGIFGDFWPDFGGLTSCPDKFCESPKACRKILTNLGKFGDLCSDKSVQSMRKLPYMNCALTI